MHGLATLTLCGTLRDDDGLDGVDRPRAACVILPEEPQSTPSLSRHRPVTNRRRLQLADLRPHLATKPPTHHLIHPNPRHDEVHPHLHPAAAQHRRRGAQLIALRRREPKHP